jgi:hypothetical protein
MRRRTRTALTPLAMIVAIVVVLTPAEVSAAPPPALVEVPVRAMARSGDGGASRVRLPLRADLLGVSWTGPAEGVEVRVQSPTGRWSRWVEVHGDAHGPDPRSREARRASSRSASDPIWVGAAVGAQVRAHEGEVARDVRVVAIAATRDSNARNGAGARARRSSFGLPYVPGGIRPREAWGAAAPKATPAIADAVRGVVIHHTDGTNTYSCAQVPAILRGIQRYHQVSRGWNDIGYNVLVDRCGVVWEGRAGGLEAAVIGAHAAGFNTGTSGIALIGTHSAFRPTARARLALQRVVAWRLDVANVRPDSKMVLTAGSGDKFPAGSVVRVRAVSGHRDLFPTSCPGAIAYRELDALARTAWRLGGAKVANVTTSFRLRRPGDLLDASVASVSARAVAPYRDEYVAFRFERISTGEVLHVSGGRGLVRQATWRVPAGVSVPAWDVRVVVNGARFNGQRARAAQRPLLAVGDDPGLAITTPPAAQVTPNGDGVDDDLVLAYTLQLDYRLQATLHDPATGVQVAELLAPTYVGPTGATPRELRLAIPATIAAGTYELRLALPADQAVGRSVRRIPVTVVGVS